MASHHPMRTPRSAGVGGPLAGGVHMLANGGGGAGGQTLKPSLMSMMANSSASGEGDVRGEGGAGMHALNPEGLSVHDFEAFLRSSNSQSGGLRGLPNSNSVGGGANHHYQGQGSGQMAESHFHRSGSAPPSVEGAAASMGGLLAAHHSLQLQQMQQQQGPGGRMLFEQQRSLSFQNTSMVHAMEDDDQMFRMQPEYHTYYAQNHNLNPRLPPPLYSFKDSFMGHQLHDQADVAAQQQQQQRGGGLTESHSSKSLFSGERGGLPTHPEEDYGASDEDDDERNHVNDDEASSLGLGQAGLRARRGSTPLLPLNWVPRRSGEGAPSGLSMMGGVQMPIGLGGRPKAKSLVDLIQEDFPRTPSPVYSTTTGTGNIQPQQPQLSRASSRGAGGVVDNQTSLDIEIQQNMSHLSDEIAQLNISNSSAMMNTSAGYRGPAGDGQQQGGLNPGALRGSGGEGVAERFTPPLGAQMSPSGLLNPGAGPNGQFASLNPGGNSHLRSSSPLVHGSSAAGRSGSPGIVGKTFLDGSSTRGGGGPGAGGDLVIPPLSSFNGMQQQQLAQSGRTRDVVSPAGPTAFQEFQEQAAAHVQHQQRQLLQHQQQAQEEEQQQQHEERFRQQQHLQQLLQQQQSLQQQQQQQQPLAMMQEKAMRAEQERLYMDQRHFRQGDATDPRRYMDSPPPQQQHHQSAGPSAAEVRQQMMSMSAALGASAPPTSPSPSTMYAAAAAAMYANMANNMNGPYPNFHQQQVAAAAALMYGPQYAAAALNSISPPPHSNLAGPSGMLPPSMYPLSYLGGFDGSGMPHSPAGNGALPSPGGLMKNFPADPLMLSTNGREAALNFMHARGQGGPMGADGLGTDMLGLGPSSPFGSHAHHLTAQERELALGGLLARQAQQDAFAGRTGSPVGGIPPGIKGGLLHMDPGGFFQPPHSPSGGLGSPLFSPGMGGGYGSGGPSPGAYGGLGAGNSGGALGLGGPRSRDERMMMLRAATSGRAGGMSGRVSAYSPRSGPGAVLSGPGGRSLDSQVANLAAAAAVAASIGSSNMGNGNGAMGDGEGRAGPGSSLLEEFKNNKTTKRFELHDILGHAVEFSADQHGSRFIQQKLETAAADEKEAVFAEILPSALELMTDVFGNYVVQKFFEHGAPLQRRKLAEKLMGHVLPLSLQMYGCRVIQKALEVVEVDQQSQLVGELDGQVMRCVRDQNGNHVVQKCIECVPSHRIAFVISSFYGQVVNLSTHPYGCRVIQRVLEHCSEEQKSRGGIMEEILRSTCTLAQDQYGNYVVQHVLERGTRSERSEIITQLAGQIVQMSQHKFASNVVEKCLEHGGPAERTILITEMLGQTEENENLQAMMKDQFANYVVQKVLETCSDQQRDMLLGRIRVHLHALKKYTYGKHIVARVEKLLAAGGRMQARSEQQQQHHAAARERELAAARSAESILA
eukprot:TRINITY_DN10_c1_g1_i1.p1 TRINITY_DN10_c1_g1~~TRINITY_DN10_c1_g1_i1.p1  ORF type:complete len:1432 (-),score=352.25 TRINITY_DN10_c1_g1_i1:840-5135(-)